MTETEELQAQISALRILVMSLIAQAPTEALIKDAKIRLETWYDMAQSTDISEEYLGLMQSQIDLSQQLLQTLREQHAARTAPETPDTNPSPGKKG